MLKLIRITNFAVVTEASIELGPGLNLLTGETGSGKSIFVEALGLLLGSRASADVVRTGARAAVVQGVFDVEGNRSLVDRLVEAGIDVSEGDLILRREITDRGRSRAFANDVVVTTALLRDLRPFLVDIHGQGDQQTLLDPGSHVDLVDDFAEAGDLRHAVTERHRAWSAAMAEAQMLHRTEAERLQRADVLAFQIDELDRAAVTAGEDEALARERTLLANAERISEAAGEAYALLYDDAASIVSGLGQVERRIEQLGRLDDRFGPYAEQLRTAKYTLDDLAQYLRDYLQDIDFRPDRLQTVEERLHELDRLKRKYGGTIETVADAHRRMRAERDAMADTAERLESISSVAASLQAAYLEKAHELSRVRREAADRLADRVRGELTVLAMEDTVFVVHIGTAADADVEHFGPSGIDRVELLVATNPGDEPRPLARIASGGEVSRLMLALKTVSAPPAIPRTLVFDEIDVGIGGRVAETIGQRLAGLSAANQVLCVTHQAQIARFADVHYAARKETVDDRAVTLLERLDGKGQVEELARMIGGSVETAKRHARELLRK